jgi:hypothetical protein
MKGENIQTSKNGAAISKADGRSQNTNGKLISDKSTDTHIDRKKED